MTGTPGESHTLDRKSRRLVRARSRPPSTIAVLRSPPSTEPTDSKVGPDVLDLLDLLDDLTLR